MWVNEDTEVRTLRLRVRQLEVALGVAVKALASGPALTPAARADALRLIEPYNKEGTK